jgi:hypothetical protein
MTTPKYTPEMVATLHQNAPLTFETATKLANQLGKNVRSIISKARSEGIEYISKVPVTATKVKAPSKAQLVEAIQKSTGSDNLDGLQGATVRALTNLLQSL